MDDKQPLVGKICMVTGANAGIGKATAFGLAEMGAAVVMVCRSQERGEAALCEISERSGNNNLSLSLADLCSQAAVRQLAAEFIACCPALHVLVNNAGCVPQKREETIEGFEMQFAVSHLAYFLLTNLLLDVLVDSAPARIVNVSSMLHYFASIDFDDLQSKKSYQPSLVYNRIKLANVLFTYELARRLEGTSVTANCLHPGVTDTKLLHDFSPRLMRWLIGIMGSRPEKSALKVLYLAASPEVEGVSGKFFMLNKVVRSSSASYDEASALRLWQVSAKMTGLPPG